MGRYYRYRLPPWCRRCLLVCEQIVLPLTIFQLIRTLFLPTTFDVILLGLFVFVTVAFFLEWF